MGDVLLDGSVDVLSFLLVDGVFKQYIREAGHDVTLKRSYWLREFYVLSGVSIFLFVFHHVPYLLSGLAIATYLFTQYPLSPSCASGTSAGACEPDNCTCKIPGNVSFRSPVAAKLGARKPHMSCESPMVTRLRNRFSERGSGDKPISPFTSFKGHLNDHQDATSTPSADGGGRPPSPPRPMFATELDSSMKSRLRDTMTRCVGIFNIMTQNFVHYRYSDVVDKMLSPVKPLLQSKIPPNFKTSVSAVRSLCVTFSQSKDFLEMLRFDINNLDASARNQPSIEFLTLLVDHLTEICKDGVVTSASLHPLLDRTFFAENLFETSLRALPRFFVVDQGREARLAHPFGDLLQEVLGMINRDTAGACREKTEEVCFQMREAVKQVTGRIEQCDGVFSGEFHCELSRLAVADAVLGKITRGKSAVSALVEGKTVDVMYCSTCDSFAYEFRPFTLFNLDILVMPRSQAKKIATLTDCFDQVASPKPISRFNPAFQCSCFDDSDKEKSISMEDKRVSFTVGTEESTESVNSGLASAKPESVHIRRTHFSQLPTYLVLDLNRFAPDGNTGEDGVTSRELLKTINHLQIPLDGLNLYEYSLAKQAVLENPTLAPVNRHEFEYSLQCVIAHDGVLFDDGQYTGYTRSANGNWYRVTGESVLQVNMTYELCTKFLRENAAVLVYRKASALQ